MGDQTTVEGGDGDEIIWRDRSAFEQQRDGADRRARSGGVSKAAAQRAGIDHPAALRLSGSASRHCRGVDFQLVLAGRRPDGART